MTTAQHAPSPVQMGGNGIVQIAYLHPEHVSHSFMESLRKAWKFDRDQGLNVLAPDPMNMRTGTGALIVQNRNFAVRLFLDRTPHEWLMFVDTDMGFEATAIHRLLDAADPVTAPFVGGLCFAHMEASYDGMNGHRFTVVPTMYRIGNVVETGHARLCYYGEYPQDTMVQVAATGAAFMLVHRSVLENVRAKYGDTWFNQIVDEDGDIVGEDFSFCLKVGAQGFPMFVHTGVKTSHHKAVWLAEQDYLLQAVAAGALEDAGVAETYPDLPVYIHLEASFAGLRANDHEHDGMWKFPQDMERYAQIITDTKPEVIVETGTHTGEFARWMAGFGVDVITVDVKSPEDTDTAGGRVTWVRGSSSDPDVAAEVAKLVDGRRCMVTLDSDHSGPHVTQEIGLYGPLVSPGCYLVVEDGIFGYGRAPRAQHFPGGLVGSPLDPIVALLVGNPDWSRDVAVERLHPVSHNPAGWWIRNG